MKKIGFMICFLFLCCLTVSAEEIEYQNVITDSTTIEEDFQVLGMNIEEYYQPKYNYSKWYVVGMSEAYDMPTYDIQTYFYIYNPMKLESFTQEIEIDGEWCESILESMTLEYKIANNKSFINTEILDTNYEHHLLKVKGFKYPFCEAARIEILSIQNLNTYMPGIVSESGFKATINHSKLNGLSVELSFNSTLIIDEYKVVEIEVKKDNNIINNWNSFWSVEDTSMLVYFYNFNFPNRIKPDSIEYAKFKYDYLTYNEKIYLSSVDWKPDPDYAKYNEKKLLERESVISEYNNTSKTLRVNKHSQELTFPTFYLGNRIKDKQFGTLEVSGDVEYFNYDCSVLLDSTYQYSERKYGNPKPMHRVPYDDINYTSLDDVEFLELWYYQDEILYKCQVVNKPVDEEDFGHGTAKPPKPDDPWYVKLWKFFVKIGEFLFKVIGKTSNEVVYGLTGIGTCILGIACGIPFIIKRIIKLVFLPGKIVAKIFGG